MKFISQLFLAVFLSFFSNGIAQEHTIDKKFDKMLGGLLSHSVKEINPKDTPAEAVFLDTREIEEFETSHIPGAIHTGYNNFDINKWTYLNKNTPIVVYCSVGYRSEKIAEQFLKKGYSNVKNLYGGIFEWKHQNKQLLKNNKPTDSIHTYNKEWSKWLKKGIKVY